MERIICNSSSYDVSVSIIRCTDKGFDDEVVYVSTANIVSLVYSNDIFNVTPKVKIYGVDSKGDLWGQFIADGYTHIIISLTIGDIVMSHVFIIDGIHSSTDNDSTHTIYGSSVDYNKLLSPIVYSIQKPTQISHIIKNIVEGTGVRVNYTSKVPTQSTFISSPAESGMDAVNRLLIDGASTSAGLLTIQYSMIENCVNILTMEDIISKAISTNCLFCASDEAVGNIYLPTNNIISKNGMAGSMYPVVGNDIQSHAFDYSTGEWRTSKYTHIQINQIVNPVETSSGLVPMLRAPSAVKYGVERAPREYVGRDGEVAAAKTAMNTFAGGESITLTAFGDISRNVGEILIIDKESSNRLGGYWIIRQITNEFNFVSGSHINKITAVRAYVSDTLVVNKR